MSDNSANLPAIFERIVTFDPAYDGRTDDPATNYGCESVTIRFVVRRDNRAVQFVLGTGWLLPESADVQAAWRERYPIAFDVGYHSPTPMYEGQTCIDDDCTWTGGECYYDGSGLRAEPLLEALIAGGSDAVWAALEREWEMRFGQ